MSDPRRHPTPDRMPTMRSTWLALALLAALLPGAHRAASAQHALAGRPPNVILIMTDDQGYGDLGAHGNPVLETPNLDRLAAQSVRFTDFHVDPTCSPTRAALMTGRYSTRTGVWHTIAGRSLLRPEETTMAELFAHNGYRTGIFGKWHLGDNYPLRPQDRGFQEVLVHGGGGIGQTPDFWGNDYFDDHYERNGEWRPHQGYCTDVFVRSALEFIESNRERPFFVYLPTNVAHSPYHVAERYEEHYRRKGVEGDLAKFYGMITELDENVGVLLSRLEEWGLAENTIVLFMTDNGSAGNGFNAGMRQRKGSHYEGGHRVPLFVRFPAGRLTGGREVDALSAHVDLLPTLAELAGLRAPRHLPWDGRSLVPLLRGEPWPERTLFVHSQRIAMPRKWRNSAVMTERWRLIDGRELYDVRADAAQATDLAAQRPDTVAALRRAYEGWWRSLQPAFAQPVRIALGSERERVSRLTAHDWHVADEVRVPWHQSMVAADPVVNGVWAVRIERPGRYEFVLRTRPDTTAHPMGAVRAGVSVGGRSRSVAVEPGATEARVELALPAGPAELRSWLRAADGSERGAYYLYVRRLPEVAVRGRGGYDPPNPVTPAPAP